jgi:very-short-patch-repair endonuclease
MALKGKQLDGLKFRSQHPVGHFVLDFYCPECQLVIEVDGDYHDQKAEEDGRRTRALEAYGYRVLRFRNEEIMSDLQNVTARILAVARDNSTVTPQPRARET